ncbi:MAG: AbrB/MazE/SpoVT family DNA-binding domain-containing protein [Egibacteraceae bacterium]
MDVRVGKRAQIVIPAPLRRQLGIKEGDLLRAEIDEAGRLILELVPVHPLERLRDAAGDLFRGVDGVEYQRSLRAEWEQ